MKVLHCAFILVCDVCLGEEKIVRSEPGIFLDNAYIGHGLFTKADKVVITDMNKGVMVFAGKDIQETIKKLTSCTKSVFPLTDIARNGGTFRISVQIYSKVGNDYTLLCQFPLTRNIMTSDEKHMEFFKWLERTPKANWVEKWGKTKKSISVDGSVPAK